MVTNSITTYCLYNLFRNLRYAEIQTVSGGTVLLSKASDDQLIHFGEKLAQGNSLGERDLATLQNCLKEARG